MSISIKRIKASETWALRHSVLWPTKPIAFIKLPNDEEGIHYGGYKNQELIAVISLYIEERDAQFRKFATAVSEQGKGYGTLLLSYVIDTICNMEVDRIWCNARVDKISFYKRFGLLATEVTFVKGGQQYVVMEKYVID